MSRPQFSRASSGELWRLLAEQRSRRLSVWHLGPLAEQWENRRTHRQQKRAPRRGMFSLGRMLRELKWGREASKL